MKIELKDGHKHLTYTPIPGFKFYGDWLDVLLARGAAYEQDGRIIPLDRFMEQRAVLLDENRVGVVCIGCGEPFEGEGPLAVKRTKNTARLLDKIKIGGFIQVKEPIQVSYSETHYKWKIQPVFKDGLGCPTCRAKFMDIVAITNHANEERAAYAALVAEVQVNGIAAQHRRMEQAETIKAMSAPCAKHRLPYCAACYRNYPKSVVEVKLPQDVTAFIDVFSKDAMGPAE